MTTVRRRWKVGALLLALIFLAAQAAEAQAIRRNVTTLTSTDVAALRRGVAVMMSRDNAPRDSADWQRSWQFWVNMHGYFSGEGECRGEIGNQTGMSTVRLWSVSNTAEERTWCGCKHNVNAFLTWHRMCLYYFERVLRQAANSSTLRLPYWDERANSQLPAIYRAVTYVRDGETVRNPLRIEDRRRGLNDGTARLESSVTTAANAMTATGYSTFRTRLEQTPHGAVHCAMVVNGCPNGIMGSVGVSPEDPVFWAHHTNIDRLYDCWLGSANGRLPTDPAILNAAYWFVDENGTLVQRTVRDMLTTDQLSYSYTTGSDCGPATALLTAAQYPQATGTEMAQRQSADTPRGESRPISTTVKVPTGGHVLHILGVQVEGSMFEVMLVGPGGKRVSAGVISSFGDEHQHGARTFDYDIRAQLVLLGTPGSVGVELLPISGIEGADEGSPLRGARARFVRVSID